jgi:hypothetical protein
MKTLVPYVVALVLLSGISHFASSQQISGPARGSMPSSHHRLNRAAPFLALPRTSVPQAAEPRKKRRREPSGVAGMQIPASAPAGTNYVVDRSVTVSTADFSPLILADFQGIPRTDSYPPDPVIAAGRQHLVTAVNREIRIFSKRGDLLERIDAAAWFDPLVPGCAPFDPRILYDHYADRYVMLWHHYWRQPDDSKYLLSVSESGDPTGEWRSWALPADVLGTTPTGTWADNGCLGLDSSGIYIVSNQYTFDTMEPSDVKIRILRKGTLYSDKEEQISWIDFTVQGAFCVRPAIIHGHSDRFFLLEAHLPLPTARSVTLYTIAGPVSNPVLTVSEVPVAGYDRATDAGQLGSEELIDTRKSYIHSEVAWMGDVLHAVLSVANPSAPSVSALKYVQINTASRTTVQDITFGAPGYWYYYPALSVDSLDNVAITFSRSSLSEFAGVHFTYRYADDGPLLRPSMPIQQGWGPYKQLDGYGANRWGDYNGAALDPTDKLSFWVMGEYADGPNVWGTWVKNVRMLPFATPALIPGRGFVDFGLTEIQDPPARSSLKIRNGGTQPLTLSGAAPSTTLFTVTAPTPWPITLSANDTVQLQVIFSPVDTGLVNADLVITSNDPRSPATRIPMSGRGFRSSPAAASRLYALQIAQSSENLHFLDTKGTINASFPIGTTGIQSICVGFSDQRLYGLQRDPHGSAILRFDGENGRIDRIGAIPLHGARVIGAWNRDTLYCATDTGSVYLFSLSTKESHLVAERRGLRFSGLAPANPGRLWASCSSPPTNDTLYVIDIGSGVVTPVGRTGTVLATEALCRAPDGGLLGYVGNSLIRIDTLSGKGSFLGFVPLEGIVGLAAGSIDSPTGVARSSEAPGEYGLDQNFPNPFNPATAISYHLPASRPGHNRGIESQVLSLVRLSVYDLLGREVASLVNEKKAPGTYWVEFDGTGLPSGIYLYRLTVGAIVKTRKMILVK